MLKRTLGALASIPWWLWAIGGVALLLRLLPVLYGLPYELDADEFLFVDSAWHVVETGRPEARLYGVPGSAVIDVLAALYGAYGVAGALVGAFDSVAGAGEAYRADVTHFFVIGRVLSAVAGTAVVLAAYAVARGLRVSQPWAAVAALALAVSWPMVQFSSIVRVDMPLALFLLLVVLLMLRVMERPRALTFVLAGVFLGLAAASKFPGVIGFVPILAANVTLTVERRVLPRQGLLWLGGAVLASTVVAFLVAPYLFMDIVETVGRIKGEARSAHVGATGEGFLSNLWAYLSDAMPIALGGVGTALGVAGLVAMLAFRRARIASLFFWALLAFISFLSLWWLRWALPLVPFVAMGAAFLVDRADRWLQRQYRGPWLTVARLITAALLVAPLLVPTATNVWARVTNDDVRLRAIDWIGENIPEGSTILVDSYSTQVESGRYDVRIVRHGELVPWTEYSTKLRPEGFFGQIGAHWSIRPPGELLAAIEDEGVEYIALSQLWLDLYQNERDAVPEHAAVYDALLTAYPVVESFDGADAGLGFPVVILHTSLSGPALDDNATGGSTP